MKQCQLILAAFTLACASTAAMAQPSSTGSYGQTRSGDTDGAFVPSSGNTTDNNHNMPSDSGFGPVNNGSSNNNSAPNGTTNTTHGASGNASGSNSNSGAGTGSSGGSSGSSGSGGNTGGSMGAGR